jgi:hypothetical protein
MKFLKLPLVLLISLLVLVGCGDSVPECGDPKTVEIVKNLTADLHKRNIITGFKNKANRMKNQMFGGMGDVMGVGDAMLGAVFQMPDPKLVSVNVKELKFMQLVSFDKEISKRTCSATVVFDIDVPKAKSKGGGGSEAEVMMMMFGITKQLDVDPVGELKITYSLTPNQQNKKQTIINVHIEH